jgi:glycosyltransferase involved in cell wall biosynthesis
VTPPLASLCIPTRDRARFLARTLASYTAQRERRFELVIVDDGSTDDTRDVARVAATELDVRYIRRAHAGVAASRNAAIRAARGELLIFTDDDRVVDPDFVADHVAAHGAGPTIVAGAQRGLFAEWAPDAAYTASDVAALLAKRPALAVVIGGSERVELVEPAQLRGDALAGTLATYALPEPWFEAQARPALARYGPALVGFPFPWTLAVGGNASVPRALLEATGLFDEQFVGWGLEDTELHYRLHQAGARTQILHGALSYHQVHRRGAERAGEWARNAQRLIAKHPALDVALYLLVTRRAIDVERAAQLLAESATAPGLAAELVRLVRGQLGAG